MRSVEQRLEKQIRKCRMLKMFARTAWQHLGAAKFTDAATVPLLVITRNSHIATCAHCGRMRRSIAVKDYETFRECIHISGWTTLNGLAFYCIEDECQRAYWNARKAAKEAAKAPPF